MELARKHIHANAAHHLAIAQGITQVLEAADARVAAGTTGFNFTCDDATLLLDSGYFLSHMEPLATPTDVLPSLGRLVTPTEWQRMLGMADYTLLCLALYRMCGFPAVHSTPVMFMPAQPVAYSPCDSDEVDGAPDPSVPRLVQLAGCMVNPNTGLSFTRDEMVAAMRAKQEERRAVVVAHAESCDSCEAGSGGGAGEAVGECTLSTIPTVDKPMDAVDLLANETLDAEDEEGAQDADVEAEMVCHHVPGTPTDGVSIQDMFHPDAE